MSDHSLTLEKAKLFVAYREMYMIFWKDWEAITEVDYDALEYLVNHSSFINLPNVQYLTEDKELLLFKYRGKLILGYSLSQ
jgi:hypothetical protein